jgi:hypothetical protein
MWDAYVNYIFIVKGSGAVTRTELNQSRQGAILCMDKKHFAIFH